MSTTPKLEQLVRGWWNRYLASRSRWANSILSWMYGQPMQVLPKGHAGLAAAVVLWYLQDGFKQFVMVRSQDGQGGTDGRARFVSCLGLGSYANLTSALRAVMEQQLGKVFADSLGENVFAADRVAAAPVFNYTDEVLGIVCPVQSLVWVVQVQHAQVELIESDARKAGGVHAVMVPEFAMSSQKVSSTHRALWQAVQRHLPKGKIAREGTQTDEAVLEESIKDVGGGSGGPRVLH